MTNKCIGSLQTCSSSYAYLHKPIHQQRQLLGHYKLHLLETVQYVGISEEQSRCKRRVLACHASSYDPETPSNVQSLNQPILSAVEHVGRVLDKQILPVVLIAFIVLGILQPQWGLVAYTAGLSNWVTIAIFIISGLQLRQGDALAVVRSTGCISFGLTSILLLTPLMAYCLLRLPLPHHALPVAFGLAVFVCMPTSLSSGISMTASCGGNSALAILLTLASNILGVFTMPLVMPALLGGVAGGTSLQPGLLLAQLTKAVLMPMLIGACLRACVPGVAAAVDGNRRAIVYASSTCLACVPWMQVSRSISQGLAISATDLGLAVVLSAACHLVFLAFNTLCVRALQLGGPNRLEAERLRQALVLLASQKTLPVAVAVIAGMAPGTAAASSSSSNALAALGAGSATGLACMTAVTAHLTQTIIDSFLVPVWTKHLKRIQAQQKAS